MAAHTLTFKDPFRTQTELALWELRQLVRILLEACAILAKKEKELLEAAISEASSRSIDSDPMTEITTLLPMVSEHVGLYHGVIPRQVNYALATSLYGCFEEQAKLLVDELAKRGAGPVARLADRDFVNELVKTLRTFGVDTSGYDPTPLKDLSTVRNNVAHTRGLLSLSKDPEKLRATIERYPALLTIRDGRLQITPEYVQKSIDQVESFFRMVFEQKGFQDGYSWTIPSSAFAVEVDRDRASILISEDPALDA